MSELEQALLAVGRELDVPVAPDLVPSVLERMEPRSRRGAWTFGRRESALLRVLHLGGERIELVDELPPAGSELDETTLGEPVTLEEARRRAGSPLRELAEPPDRVYLLGTRPTVWFVYGAPGDVQLLVSQAPGLVVDRNLIAKKLVGEGTSLEETDVDGSPAFFLSGAPHVVLLLDDRARLLELLP